MKEMHRIEPTSKTRLINTLGLAIEEVKLVRTIAESRNQIDRTQQLSPFPDRLAFLNREISMLEERLEQIRCSAGCDPAR